MSDSSTLVERLGFDADAKVLIVNCDDLGSSHAANVGTYEALRTGLATSASLMVPCPWAREAASRYRGEDVGVHLTLNAEHDLYRWGPITHAPSLLDGDGGFPRTVVDLWDHADVDEVRRELRAQIERAIYWGFDVTHLDSHLDVLQLRPEFFDVMMELAADFRLPVRLGGPQTEALAGFPFRTLARREGVAFPDHVVRSPVTGGRTVQERAISQLAPGVTEINLHPCSDTPEIRSLSPDWPGRVQDHLTLCSMDSFVARAQKDGVHFIGYRLLRDLMRSRPTTGPHST
ncbi:MAG: polysaccharide deacetylase family protein [Acidimicrobiales bacterium]